MYDKAFNESFHEKLESLEYNAALAITGGYKRVLYRKTVRGTWFRISKIKTLVQKNEPFL